MYVEDFKMDVADAAIFKNGGIGLDVYMNG